MSLDIYLLDEVSRHNITHNLGKMAKEAGIYGVLWRPEENQIYYAGELIKYIESAIEDMEARPDHYKQFDSPNGWGTYEHFVPFLRNLLFACREYPDARIEACR